MARYGAMVVGRMCKRDIQKIPLGRHGSASPTTNTRKEFFLYGSVNSRESPWSAALTNSQEQHRRRLCTNPANGSLRNKAGWSTLKSSCGTSRNHDIPLIADGTGLEYTTTRDNADCFGGAGRPGSDHWHITTQ